MQNIVLGCNGVMAAPSLAPISALFSTGDLISRRPLSTFGPLFPATLSVQRPLSTPLSFLQAPPLSSLCSSCSIERRDTVAMSSSSYTSTSPEEDPDMAKLAQAPPRAEVVKRLRNGIVINVLGMGATVLGMQATIGLLVAKALTSSATPYYQGLTPGYSPVLALDVFLVQACANTVLSHFLGLIVSLELLRSVTSPSSEAVVVPKVA
ncbi:hypothetical protein AMTRI_Chr13g86400 [Amborella trichopoda]